MHVGSVWCVMTLCNGYGYQEVLCNEPLQCFISFRESFRVGEAIPSVVTCQAVKDYNTALHTPQGGVWPIVRSCSRSLVLTVANTIDSYRCCSLNISSNNCLILESPQSFRVILAVLRTLQPRAIVYHAQNATAHGNCLPCSERYSPGQFFTL